MQAIINKLKLALGLKRAKKTSQPLNKNTAPLSIEEKGFNDGGSNSNKLSSSSEIAKFSVSGSNISYNPVPKYDSSNYENSNYSTKKDLPVFDATSFNESNDSNNSYENQDSNDSNDNNDNEELFQDLEKILSISDDVLRLLTGDFCIEYRVLPIELVNNVLTIAFINLPKKGIAEKLLSSQYPELTFQFVKSSEKFLLFHIHESYSGLTSRIAREHDKRVMHEHALKVSQLDKTSSVVSEIKFYHSKSLDAEQNRLLGVIESALCEMKAIGGTDLDIDFRIKTLPSGVKQGFLELSARVERDYILLHEIPMTLEVYNQIPRLLKVISRRESTLEKEICTSKLKAQLNYGTKSTLVQLRINFLPASEDRGISISIRLQDRENFIHNLENIGLTRHQREIFFREVVKSGGGLVLVAAPINHGKNTSCLSMLKEKNKLYPNRKLVTVEDPIEYDLAHGVQIEVDQENTENAKGYADYIRPILRHNLNDMYIGEIRDEESAAMAIRGADLGISVISTVHTYNACDAISRLRSLKISPYQISNVLRVVVSQRLVKKICSECVKVFDDSYKDISRLDEYIGKLNWNGEANFVRGSGKDVNGNICRNCNGTGYRGVTGIFEILKLSRTLRTLISNGANSDELRFAAQKEGFKSLWYAGLEKCLMGETTLEQVLFVLETLPIPDLEGLPALDALGNKNFYDSFEDVLAN